MEYTTSERILVAEFSKHIIESLKEGSLSEEMIVDSEILPVIIKLLLIYFYILESFEPLTYEEIKDLAAMAYLSIVAIILKRSDAATAADNIWERYKPRFIRHMVIRNDIINDAFSKYELYNTRLDIGDGISIPLSREGFIEEYNAIYPFGYPNCWRDCISAINKIAKCVVPSTIFYRRPVAFCVCLLIKAGKYDISDMSKKKLEQFIRTNFKDEKTGKPIASAQRVVNTLLGYDSRIENEKAMLNYNKNEKWEFKEDNFNHMKKFFPDDYNRALEMVKKLK